MLGLQRHLLEEEGLGLSIPKISEQNDIWEEGTEGLRLSQEPQKAWR